MNNTSAPAKTNPDGEDTYLSLRQTKGRNHVEEVAHESEKAIVRESKTATNVVGHKSVMEKLSDENLFFNTLEEIFNKYVSEISDLRPKMRNWCKQTNSCKYTDCEVEMLYMLIREHKPQNVFEITPNRGFRSNWILHALHKNDETSKLHSFDIHDASVNIIDD